LIARIAGLHIDEYALMNIHDDQRNQELEEMKASWNQVKKGEALAAFYCLAAVPSMPRDAVVLRAPPGEALG
jgi:hypothetical protein